MMKPMRNLIVIAGPTASGKTEMAVRVAQMYDTCIISADARQFYKEIPIGTAAPDAITLQSVQHHFVGHLSIHDPFDAGMFAEATISLLETLFLEHNTVVLCGGSGLFIKAVTDGLDTLPDVPAEIREQVRALFSEHGLLRLQQEVAARDPEYYQKADIKNPMRLMRALEICLATGKTYSEFRAGNPVPRAFTSVKICLDIPRSELYQRIDARVDAMMQAGLLEEARRVYPHRHVAALQTVGYKELFDHFDGKYTLPEAITAIKQHSRNYAKRQVTWFKHTGGYHLVHPKTIDQYLIEQYIKRSN